ncbi:uncharacterized protein DS421_7g219200 [Arachis hypogaea]|nr:uncharacterized protein DS421_7g219200 [Arachis hypogaea]
MDLDLATDIRFIGAKKLVAKSVARRTLLVVVAFNLRKDLMIFCVINMLNYVDHGAIASNGVNENLEICDDSGICTAATEIQENFYLRNFRDGVLSSAFMVGLLITSQIFASLAKRSGCGSSLNFWPIAICRMLVGVGEASFISLAVLFIDDNAHVEQKIAWLATFYMCIPTGTNLGYVYGGLVGGQYNWHIAFWDEAILMFPFPILDFIMKHLQLKGFTPMESKLIPTSNECRDGEMLARDESFIRGSKSLSILKNHIIRFSKDMLELLCDQVYVRNVLGYISYNFIIGAYSITIVCGICGTLAGGLILDKMTSTISNALSFVRDMHLGRLLLLVIAKSNQILEYNPFGTGKDGRF